jgi:CheY-like chemotaxis protein
MGPANNVSTIMDETEPGRNNQQIAELGRDLLRVLHVEDDPNCREAIADQLSDHGFVVHSFADAVSLVDALGRATEADIILLDWDLPEVSGIELLVELRRYDVNLPVVFLTGYGFHAQENLAFESGAVDFIDKAPGCRDFGQTSTASGQRAEIGGWSTLGQSRGLRQARP